MTLVNKNIDANIWGSETKLIEDVRLIQGENRGRKLGFTIYDHDRPFDLTDKEVTLFIEKPDKTFIYTPVEVISPEQGYVEFIVTTQMVVIDGPISIEFHIKTSSEVLLKTSKVYMIVEKAIDMEEAVQSHTEFPYFEQLVANYEVSLAESQEILEDLQDIDANESTRQSNEAQRQIDTAAAIASCEAATAGANNDRLWTRESCSGNYAEIYPTSGSQIYPKIKIKSKQSGTGDPSPDNIRSLVGYDKLYIKKSGKNLLPGVNFTNPITINGVTFTPLDEGGYLKLNGTSTNNIYMYINDYDGGRITTYPGVYYSSINNYSDSAWSVFKSKTESIFSVTDNNNLIINDVLENEGVFYYRIGSGITFDDYIIKPQVIYYDQIYSEYELYNKETEDYIIEFSDMIYCDSIIDFERGVIIKEWNYLEFDGTENWYYNNNIRLGNQFYIELQPGYYGYYIDFNSKNIISSHYKSSYNSCNMSNTCFLYRNPISEKYFIFINDDRFDNLNDFKNYLISQYNSETPVSIGYKLLEPIEENIDLPIIKALSQKTKDCPTKNIISSSCDIIEILYSKSPMKNDSKNNINWSLKETESNITNFYPISESNIFPNIHIIDSQLGTGEPSPDNIRPIQGIDNLNIIHTNNNLVDIDIIRSDKELTNAYLSTYNTIKIKNIMTFNKIRLSFILDTYNFNWDENSPNKRIGIEAAYISYKPGYNKKYIGVWINSTSSNFKSIGKTLVFADFNPVSDFIDGEYLVDSRFKLYIQGYLSGEYNISNFKISILKSDVLDSCEYNNTINNLYNIDLPDTLYDAIINFKKNSIIKNKFAYILTGYEVWNMWLDNPDNYVSFYITIPEESLNIDSEMISSLKSSHFKSLYQTLSTAFTEGIAVPYIKNNRVSRMYITIRKDRLTEVSVYGFTNWLKNQYNSGTPVTVVAGLEEPVEIPFNLPKIKSPIQLDPFVPVQNILTTSEGTLSVGYAKSPIRESQEIQAFLEGLGT